MREVGVILASAAIMGFIAFVIAGCNAEAQKVDQVGGVKISLIAEYDGMKIYRVKDGSAQTFYLADQRSCVSYKQPQGKYTVPRVMTSGGNVDFKQDGDEIIMQVRFKVQPIVEKE